MANTVLMFQLRKYATALLNFNNPKHLQQLQHPQHHAHPGQVWNMVKIETRWKSCHHYKFTVNLYVNLAVPEWRRGRCRRRALHSEHREVELVAVVVAAQTEETAAPAAFHDASRARGPPRGQDFDDEPAAHARPRATAAAAQLHEPAGSAVAAAVALCHGGPRGGGSAPLAAAALLQPGSHPPDQRLRDLQRRPGGQRAARRPSPAASARTQAGTGSGPREHNPGELRPGGRAGRQPEPGGGAERAAEGGTLRPEGGECGGVAEPELSDGVVRVVERHASHAGRHHCILPPASGPAAAGVVVGVPEREQGVPDASPTTAT